MSKHTPGPWVGYEDRGVYLGDGFKRPIFETGCNCCTADTLKAADAHLIAAAPEMLEALQYLSGLHPRRCNLAEVTRARAAIAKATGDSNG